MANHTHPHRGDHEWRESTPTPGPASVLDIGDGVGALMVRLGGDTPSGELMACPRGAPDRHFHTGVHHRVDGETAAWVAVFPAIDEGEYSLIGDDGGEHTPFTVVGGEVTSLTLDG